MLWEREAWRAASSVPGREGSLGYGSGLNMGCGEGLWQFGPADFSEENVQKLGGSRHSSSYAGLCPVSVGCLLSLHRYYFAMLCSEDAMPALLLNHPHVGPRSGQ
jgi:hypothetical protein